MKRTILITAALALALGLLAACSDDDTTPTGPQGGNLNDPDFLAMQDFVDESDAMGSYERSMDLTFALLDHEFEPVSKKPGRWYAGADAAADVSIISATYTFHDTTGWHVWDVTAQLVDESDTIDVTGTDSVRIVAGGETWDGSGTDTLTLLDVDTLYARAHFQWSIPGTNCSGAGHHAIQLSLLPLPAPLGSLVLSASVRDTLVADSGCISANCTLLLASTADFTNLTFPMEPSGMDVEPAGCPTSGSLSLSMYVDLACSGEGDPDYDSLTINGTWTITANVFTASNIRFTFSDGTTTWSFTDDCTADPSTSHVRLPRALARD